MEQALIILYKLCAIQARMCSSSEDVLCESGTSSVQVSTSTSIFSSVPLYQNVMIYLFVLHILTHTEDVPDPYCTSSVYDENFCVCVCLCVCVGGGGGGRDDVVAIGLENNYI